MGLGDMSGYVDGKWRSGWFITDLISTHADGIEVSDNDGCAGSVFPPTVSGWQE